LNKATGTNVLAFTEGAHFDGQGNLIVSKVDDSTLALQQGRWTVDPAAKNKINGKDDISVDYSNKLIAYSQGKNDEGLYAESYVGQDMTKGNKKYVSVADSNAFMLTGTFAKGKKDLPETGLHYDLDKTWVYQKQDSKGNFVLPKGTFVRFGDNLKFFVTEKDNGVTNQRKVEYQNTKTKDGKTEAVYGVKNLSFLEAQAGSEDVVSQSVKLDFTTEFGVEQDHDTKVVHTDGIVPVTLALTSKGSIVQPEAKAEGVTWRLYDAMATGWGDQRTLNVSPKTAVIVTKQDKDGIITTEFLGGENTNKISFKADDEVENGVKLREQRKNSGWFSVKGENNVTAGLSVIPTVLKQNFDIEKGKYAWDVADGRWNFGNRYLKAMTVSDETKKEYGDIVFQDNEGVNVQKYDNGRNAAYYGFRAQFDNNKRTSSFDSFRKLMAAFNQKPQGVSDEGEGQNNLPTFKDGLRFDSTVRAYAGINDQGNLVFSPITNYRSGDLTYNLGADSIAVNQEAYQASLFGYGTQALRFTGEVLRQAWTGVWAGILEAGSFLAAGPGPMAAVNRKMPGTLSNNLHQWARLNWYQGFGGQVNEWIYGRKEGNERNVAKLVDISR
ncbi:MAG TPA: hypothetical protein PLO93_06555, partial [Candidatus Omnitrophota bacterium]|nr:hypothetical protein [Candidatus Omnitrophota bacterium]